LLAIAGGLLHLTKASVSSPARTGHTS